MTTAGLLGRQVRFTNLAFWRNPASAFFTFAFPLMFLVIFTSLLGSGRLEVAPGIFIEQDRYYVAAMASFSVITATYTNLAISVSFQRDAGILKRTRGTPVPAAVYLSARVIHAILVSLLLVVITATFGILVYGAGIPTGTALLEFIVTVIVGAMAFSALGLLVVSRAKTVEAVSGLMNVVMLPMWLLSGSFFAADRFPHFMQPVVQALPLTIVNNALRAIQNEGAGLAAVVVPVAILAAWVVVGFALALWLFRWE